MTHKENEGIKLSQIERIRAITEMNRNSSSKMISVFLRKKNCFISLRGTIDTAVIPKEYRDKSLDDHRSDIDLDHHLPSWTEDQGEKKYLKYGHTSFPEVEPLVIPREWGEIEIAEEFRLMFNLKKETDKNGNESYFKVDFPAEGNVVTVQDTEDEVVVKIRMKEIREYLSIKGMILSLYFYYMVDSDLYTSFENLGINIEEWETTSVRDGKGLEQKKLNRDRGFSYRLVIGPDTQKKQIWSILIGKVLIEPSEDLKRDFFDEKEAKYVDFIIDEDEQGEVIEHTCDPENLDMYWSINDQRFYAVDGDKDFGKQIYFKKKVLEKYEEKNHVYKIKRGRTGGKWTGLALANGYHWQIDIWEYDDKIISTMINHLHHLSYEEQLWWRQNNISPPDDKSDRWFDGERPQVLFSKYLEKLKETSQQNLGWPLLKELNDDQYLLTDISKPMKNKQPDFDSRVQGLSTVLIDSINVQKINQEIRSSIPEGEWEDNKTKGSIQKLEIFFQKRGVKEYEGHITFLKNLYRVRNSCTSAHRRSQDWKKQLLPFEGAYENREGQLEVANLGNTFHKILEVANCYLKFLIRVFERG